MLVIRYSSTGPRRAALLLMARRNTQRAQAGGFRRAIALVELGNGVGRGVADQNAAAAPRERDDELLKPFLIRVAEPACGVRGEVGRWAERRVRRIAVDEIPR